jgi:hypothetical protein
MTASVLNEHHQINNTFPVPLWQKQTNCGILYTRNNFREIVEHSRKVASRLQFQIPSPGNDSKLPPAVQTHTHTHTHY